MRQHGADLHITDLQGKTALHHAVMGGNMWVMDQYNTMDIWRVVLWLQHSKHVHPIVFISPSAAVHYLWETGMFQFSDTDMYRVTPLHLAASTGNTEMIRYLLREQVLSSLLPTRSNFVKVISNLTSCCLNVVFIILRCNDASGSNLYWNQQILCYCPKS